MQHNLLGGACTKCGKIFGPAFSADDAGSCPGEIAKKIEPAKPAIQVRPADDVAIVCAGRNNGQYLDEALRSAVATGVPVIYSDDYSTDNSVEIARRYPVAVLTSDSHCGVSIARNKGWRATRARNIIFLDADDHVPRDFVAKHRLALEANPDAPFAYGPTQAFGDKHILWGVPEWSSYDKWWQNTVNTSAIWRRWALEAVGGWNTELETMWDWDLALKCSRLGQPAKSEACLNYRQHANSFSARCNEQKNNHDIRRKIRRQNIQLSVVSLVSGRLGSSWTRRWLDNLVQCVRFAKTPAELILCFHNSEPLKDLPAYDNTFSSARYLRYDYDIDRASEQSRQNSVASMLARYSGIMQSEANGDLILMVEDDMWPDLRALRYLIEFIIDGDVPPLAVGAGYVKRQMPRYLVGCETLGATGINYIERLPSEPTQVERIGTGFTLYWRDRPQTPKSWRSHYRHYAAHDWAWCDDIHKLGGTVWLHPYATVGHADHEANILYPK